MEKRVGVVILNFNSKKLSVELAEKISVFKSIKSIVVVDNNSNDLFQSDDFLSNKIHFIQSESNKGYASGNNIGLRYLIEQHNCEIVFIANPDVDFTNETISAIVNAFESDDKLAICSSLRYGLEGEKIHQYFKFQTFKDAVANCFFMGRRIINKNKVINQVNRVRYSTSKIIFVDAVPGAFFAMSSSFLKKINYLYEGTFLYYEEYFIGQSAKMLGYNAGIINETIYYHNHKLNPLSKSNRSMFYKDRKSMLLYFKHFKILNFRQLLILNVCVLLGSMEYFLISYVYLLFKKVRRLI